MKTIRNLKEVKVMMYYTNISKTRYYLNFINNRTSDTTTSYLDFTKIAIYIAGNSIFGTVNINIIC
jgi:hypothetical protein